MLGVLQLTDRGAGFIRRAEARYLPAPGDVYVPPETVRRFGLRPGDEIAGEVARSRGKGRGKGPRLQTVTEVNGRPPAALEGRPDFSRRSAVHPSRQLVLECEATEDGRPDYTNRIVDLLCPLGWGQRAIIAAPAKAGKTTILRTFARGIVENHPGAQLLILLVDERPEEVTEIESCGYGEVVSSSFDFPPERHVTLAELTLERARRRVELDEDVVIILDSITRLARAFNSLRRGSGRTLSGGLDASSMEGPKRFLGSARAIDPSQGGGSLTIIGTALIDTGSVMDQVIYEEFKGTGNSEVVLSRALAERRLFPAIDIQASATRREELLLSPDALRASQLLRRRLAGADPADALREVLGLMKATATNAELIRRLSTAD